VVVRLVGDSNAETMLIRVAEANRFDGVKAFFIFNLGTSLLIGCRANRVGLCCTRRCVSSDLDLPELRDRVVDRWEVETAVSGDGDGTGYLLKCTIFPNNVFAVLVAGPNFLSQVVDDPLGLAVLLRDVFADRGLVVFNQGFLSSLGTFLGYKLVGVNNIVVVETGEGFASAIGKSNNIALSDRYGNTGRTLPDLASPVCSVGAELVEGDVVLNLAVRGDINTVLVVAVPMVIATRESGDQGKS